MGRMAAFQALGPFISTFADPEVTALLRNENGEIVVTDTAALSVRLAKAGEGGEDQGDDDDGDEEDEEVVAVGKKDNDDMDLGEGESWGEEQTSSLGDRESPEEKRAQAHLESWPGFSAFLYWREPVIELPGYILGDLLESHENGAQCEDGGSEAEEVIVATKVETNNGGDKELGSDQVEVVQ